MCPTVNGFHFGADDWNVAFYEVMSGLAKTTRAAHEKARQTTRVLAFPARLWMLERNIRAFVEFLKHPEKGYKGSRPSDEASSKPVDPAVIAEGLIGLAESLDQLYAVCKRSGWTNRTITAASLNLLNKYAGFMRDFGEVVFVAIDPETEARFKDARLQYEAGETVGLEAIR